MSFARQTIEQKLKSAAIAIENAQAEPSITQALAGFGYTAERLRQGAALHERALVLCQRYKGAYGDAQTANDAHAAALAAAQATYMRYVKLARIALEGERGMRQKLGLAGERKHTQAGQLAQAQQFYANALLDITILGKLAASGITKAMLVVGQQQLEAAAHSDAIRRQRQGAARDAMRARDEALLALGAWMRDFTQVARIALRDRPQLLQMLGISAPPARRAPRPSSDTAHTAPVVHTAAPLPTSRTLTTEDQPAQSAAAKRNGTKVAGIME
jgi:hypothetical protein